MVVLVTGANGQLGQSLQFVAHKYPEIQFVFCSSSQLDITDKTSCTTVFQQYQPQYCINAAAYTAVDKAESEPDKAYLINAIGAKNLAEGCLEFDTCLLHISTDFVFDGNQKTPYNEQDATNPISVYGQTKLEGEKFIQEIVKKYFIIRTSWVYSQFGTNFMKTMLRLAAERDTLNVVSDQIGTPTNAVDLAESLIQIINSCSNNPSDNRYGIYHFSNEGVCSWYDFAREIFKLNHSTIEVNPIPTSSYPTPAKRPYNSVLDKTKIKETFSLSIKEWNQRLAEVFLGEQKG